jgi:putative ABC transport system permease protein
MDSMGQGMLAMLNGPLLLVVVAAGLGVVNTIAMSVTERRQELGLLRAVGAARRQVRAVILGEAILIGGVGSLLGVFVGLGLTSILVLAGDHGGWGVREVPLWDLLRQVSRMSFLNGIVGMIAAPIISALAAWLPARAILRGTAIEALDAQRQRYGTTARQRRTRRGPLWRRSTQRTGSAGSG